MKTLLFLLVSVLAALVIAPSGSSFTCTPWTIHNPRPGLWTRFETHTLLNLCVDPKLQQP